MFSFRARNQYMQITHAQEKERERERVCYIVLRVLTSITKLLAYCFQKKSLLLPANASRSVDLPQPEGPIIARSSPGRA